MFSLLFIEEGTRENKYGIINVWLDIKYNFFPERQLTNERCLIINYPIFYVNISLQVFFTMCYIVSIFSIAFDLQNTPYNIKDTLQLFLYWRKKVWSQILFY